MKNHAIRMSTKKRFLGGSIQVCPTCSYHNINWQENPVHLNIIIILFFLYPKYFMMECCRPCVLLRHPKVVQTLQYPSCFLVLISSLSYCEKEKKKSRNMGVYDRGFLGSIYQVCPTSCSYHNINRQENPVHLNICVISEIFYRVLLPLGVVKATQSCEDSVVSSTQVVSLY